MWFLVFMLVALSACASTLAAASTPQSAYALYRTAVLKGDGPAAASQLSQDSFEIYSDIRRRALCASRSSLRSDPLLERIIAMAFRYQADLDFLQDATGEQLAAFAISEGWIRAETLAETTLTEVEYYDGYAIGQVEGRGLPASYVRLVREAGAWKLDLRPFLRQSNEVIASQSLAHGTDEDAFILDLIERRAGTQPAGEIWKPPLGGTRYCQQ